MAKVPVQRNPTRITDTPGGIDLSRLESPFSQVAQGTLALRDALAPVAAKAGERAGVKSVHTAEDGTPVVDQGFDLFDVLSPDYAAAKKKATEFGYMARLDASADESFEQFRQKAPLDHKAFDSAASTFIRDMQSKAPAGLSEQTYVLLNRKAGQVKLGIMRRADAHEIETDLADSRALVDRKAEQFVALARQNGLDTKEGKEAFGDFVNVLDGLRNPIFGLGDEQVNLIRDRVAGRAKLADAESTVMAIYTAKGEEAAVREALDIAGNPSLALDEPAREEWLGDMRQRINELESFRSRETAGLSRLTARSVDDAVATYKAGNDAADQVAALREQGWPGLKSDQIEIAEDEIAQARREGQAVKALQGADPAERARVLQSFPVDGVGAAANARTMAALSVEAGRIATRLDKDPAAQVLRSNPELVNGLGEALKNNDPAAFADAAADLLDEQRRLGAVNPRILTRSQRKLLVRNVMGDADDPERQAKMIEEIQGLAAASGAHFPRLLAELADEEDLSPAAYGIGLVPPGSQAAVELAAAASEDPKVLRQNVAATGTGAMNDLRDKVAARMAPMVESLAASGETQTKIQKNTDAVHTLAMRFVVRGDSVGDAAGKAFDTVFGGYTFEGTYRVPAGVNADHVRDGLRRVRELQTARGLLVPRHDPRLSEEGAQKSYLRHLSAFGQWATNADETGLMLNDGNGDPVMWKSANPGEPPERVQFSWEQLEAMGRGGTEFDRGAVRSFVIGP